MKMVDVALMETKVSADITTLRTVKRSIKAAAKGATKPKRSTFIDTAKEICDRDQPKASSRGTIKTDGAERYPADAINVKNVTVTAIHPG